LITHPIDKRIPFLDSLIVSPSNMLSLLDIPREVRDKILSFVIDAPSTAPAGPYVGNRQELWDNRTESIPTLLVNRQLHAETLAAIALLSTKHSYVLDIMIVNEDELWPTWLSVPSLTTRVDKVYVAFRTFGIGKGLCGFTRGDGGPELIVWHFYDLLERFLRVGPLPTHGGDPDRRVSIGTLELDIRTPDVPKTQLPPNPYLDSWRLAQLRRMDGIDYIMHPEHILNFLKQHIDTLLSMQYAPADGSIAHERTRTIKLYERIGTIKLMLDGKLRKDWDLAKGLAELRISNTAEQFSWKSVAYKARIGFGLPVVPFEG
jgi:hypothetical protein